MTSGYEDQSSLVPCLVGVTGTSEHRAEVNRLCFGLLQPKTLFQSLAGNSSLRGWFFPLELEHCSSCKTAIVQGRELISVINLCTCRKFPLPPQQERGTLEEGGWLLSVGRRAGVGRPP